MRPHRMARLTPVKAVADRGLQAREPVLGLPPASTGLQDSGR